MTTQLEQAARQALEAFEEAVDYVNDEASSPSMERECREAITALRAALSVSSIQCEETSHALEQPSNVKQVIELYDSPEQPAQDEPWGWMHEWNGLVQVNRTVPEAYGDQWTHTPLYTHPQAREPLTDEVIAALWSWSQSTQAESIANTQQHAFARAIEAAHGIKELK